MSQLKKSGYFDSERPLRVANQGEMLEEAKDTDSDDDKSELSQERIHH
jgi:hypothetical protein